MLAVHGFVDAMSGATRRLPATADSGDLTTSHSRHALTNRGTPWQRVRATKHIQTGPNGIELRDRGPSRTVGGSKLSALKVEAGGRLLGSRFC